MYAHVGIPPWHVVHGAATTGMKGKISINADSWSANLKILRISCCVSLRSRAGSGLMGTFINLTGGLPATDEEPTRQQLVHMWHWSSSSGLRVSSGRSSRGSGSSGRFSYIFFRSIHSTSHFLHRNAWPQAHNVRKATDHMTAIIEITSIVVTNCGDLWRMADAAGLELKTFKSNVGMKLGMKLKPRVQGRQVGKLIWRTSTNSKNKKTRYWILRENGGFF